MDNPTFLSNLPPLKRLRLQHQRQQQQHQISANSPLPAKKRKEPRNAAFHPNPPPSPSASPPSYNATVYSLPAKKRICALQPHFPPIDLNLEYNPFFDSPQKPQISTPSPQKCAEEEKGDGDVDVDDDGILCCVCQSTDGDPTDPIVLCDGCDLMVHASCYGNPLSKGVPEGDWFCERCRFNKGSDSDSGCCCLCPVKEGAVKRTTDNRWAHIVCALLVPEVFFLDSEGREGIDCSMVPKKRWLERCYLCGSSGGDGCAIVCSEPKCCLAFHVTCAIKEDLCIEYQQGNKAKASTVVAGFCKTHSQLWEKLQQSGKYKIVANEDK